MWYSDRFFDKSTNPTQTQVLRFSYKQLTINALIPLLKQIRL